MYYAQIDNKNKCIGIHDMEENQLPNLIHLESYQNVIGKVWNSGEWTDAPPEPTPEPKMTDTEEAIMETAVNVDYLVCISDLGI